MLMERSFAVAAGVDAGDVYAVAAGDGQMDYSFGTEEYDG